MTSFTYHLGFAASVMVPPDQVAVIDVTVAEPTDFIDLHEHIVSVLSDWIDQTPEGQQLREGIEAPMSLGEVVMALDSLTLPSFTFWASQAGLHDLRVMASNAVFDLDALIAE